MFISKELHIIIAEDDVDDAETILYSFEKHPAFKKVDIVANGKELLDYLRSQRGAVPDIILTDINMPIVNGIEALTEIQADETLSKIPAFVYSTAINPIYEAKSAALGVKGFLIKPFSLREFEEIPNKIIGVLEQGSQSGQKHIC